ncbi:hypothetical protein WJ0W_001179 [Paenibacillus melissococcoides]|uniref:Inositol monophosphatase n=1 Tax=Paenibacillus melissococcoides TaxID=2912268 RepID=A0ABM9FXJ5_9BACL|nr:MULTISPECIES: hypothetical protein [Paenibacillus]MEB9894265.1 hypothetical protein [Bacillus cereus]CAH8243940.1 hypothetical protein WJ0W_001179 [Paenibacillus melissococcoides]CAH8704170.1 hypothetical protein HTL2_000476 [Paenibacillus melissococcoides]CAH8706917.1 hypothetical protein WDD9_001438 [Paenibacillus melissococcoides]GIO80149.1 hypothetical protein J6TS7_37590 [Paenibacillus dendritiformis]
MNRTILHEAKEVAVSAAQAAGAIIKRRFDTKPVNSGWSWCGKERRLEHEA